MTALKSAFAALILALSIAPVMADESNKETTEVTVDGTDDSVTVETPSK